MTDVSVGSQAYTISEVYDILNNVNGVFSKRSNEYLLHRPSDVANLKEIRFRSFKPIMKHSISTLQEASTVKVTITPTVWNYISGGDSNTAFYPGYQLYNVYDNVMMPVTQQTIVCEFAGDIETLLNNINESIASYCDNIKSRNGYFKFVNQSDGTTTQFGMITTIEDWLQEVQPPSKIKSVQPSKMYTQIKYNNDSDEFVTENVVFPLVMEESGIQTLTVMLVFIVDVVFDPYDMFHVSSFRQLFNCVDYCNKNEGKYYVDNNDCISTNADFNSLITAANYRYNGLDLVLKCGLMKNLTSIVYVNDSEAQIVMKGFDVQSSTSYIPVYITDIKGNMIPDEYIRDIYSSVLIEVEYVYGGLI